MLGEPLSMTIGFKNFVSRDGLFKQMHVINRICLIDILIYFSRLTPLRGGLPFPCLSVSLDAYVSGALRILVPQSN